MINIIILILVLSLILTTQVVALFVQYKFNKSYIGTGYWLIGSGLMAVGYIFMPLVMVESVEKVARIAHPIQILGHLFIYVGIKTFFNKKLNKWIPILIYSLFNLVYYYYMFVDNNLNGRSITISITVAIISFLIVYDIVWKNEKLVFISAKFLAVVFIIYGFFYIFRIFLTISLPITNAYVGQDSTAIVTVVVSIIFSNLWTFGLIVMVNQKLHIDNQLEKEKLQLIFNTNLDAQLITRFSDGIVVDANDKYASLSGYKKEDIIGSFIKNNSFWYNQDDRERFIKELTESGKCENLEFIFKRKDESQFAGIISARIIIIHSVPYIISVIRDISERQKFEYALIESEEKYRSILKASPDDITITDLSGNIVMISEAAKQIFGYEEGFNDFIGMKLLDFIIPEDVNRAQSKIKELFQGVTRSTNEYKAVRKDKSIFDVEVNSGLIYNASGQPDKMVFIVRDITRRKLIETQMEKLVQQLEIEKNTAQLNSITDSLTGLFNRGYFDKTLRTELSRSTRTESDISLIMLDIDYFKKYNDTYGHIAGDKCIQMIASTLKNSLEREPDIAARYGGEEFIVILPDTGENGVRLLGERIRKDIEDLAIIHETSDVSKFVTVSVGAITVNSNDNISPDKALKLVDEALYSAKAKGRNCCIYFNSAN